MERKPKRFNRGKFQGIWSPESKSLDVYKYQDSGPLTFYPDIIETHKFSTYTEAESWFFNRYN